MTQVLLFNLTHVFCKVQLEQIFSRIWKCRSSACCEIKSFEEKSITISLSHPLLTCRLRHFNSLPNSKGKSNKTKQEKLRQSFSVQVKLHWLHWLPLIFLGTCYHCKSICYDNRGKGFIALLHDKIQQYRLPSLTAHALAGYTMPQQRHAPGCKQCPAGRVFQYRVGSGIGQNTG